MRAPELRIDVLGTDNKTASWMLPEEVPVALIYNGLTYAIMLCTPKDIEDFAVGFSMTERIITAPSELVALEVESRKQGLEVHIKITQDRAEALELVLSRRNLAGRSCGVCGLDSEVEFFESLQPVSKEPLLLDEVTITRALEQFESRQELKMSNKSVHGAAWVSLSGDQIYGQIDFVREDVGRHNALDKLVGATLRSKTDFGAGFLIISSRCSYDIILKAARSRMRSIVSLSAPTAFALAKAQQANISLYTVTKTGCFRVYP